MEQNTTHNQKIIQNFLRYLISKGVSASSLKYYKSDIANFLSWAADRKIDNKLVREYINSQRLTTPLSTLNRRLSTLRSYSNFVGQNFMSGIENVTNYQKVTKSWQDAILNKFESKPKLKNLFSKILFNRPNWYKKYHSFALANYIHIAILILFSSLSGYAVYDQVFYSTDRPLAFPTALERPNRFLSFQGRLTDNLGNPETVATNVVFKLYSVSSGGVALWDSGTCSITPDQDGIFSTLLGSSCGAEITSSVFSENADIWLGVTVGADAEATPRIQIATVAYALNSETLQGFPAGTGTSTIPYINSSGVLVMANASPKIQSTSGTFAVEGVALTLSTPNTSNGIVTINPDGTGTLDLTFEGAAPGGGANGFVNATNANITSGSLYSGTVASGATGYNFINFLAGVSPTSVFSVQNDGDIVTSGDITIGGGNINTGNIALTIGDATTDSITLTTDGTGNGEVVLPNDSIGPNEILSSGQTDEYCLTYETTSTTLEWQVCSAAGTMSSFTVAGDSGGGQAISDTNTLSILGGTNGIDTVDSVTDTVTLNLDTTEIGTTTFGSGSGITWTFDAGATDPTLIFGSNSITASSLAVTGAFDSNGEVTIADTNIAFDGASTTFTTTGAFTITPGGAVVIGDNGDTLSIDTNDWDITTAGNMSGIGTISSDGDWTNSQATPSIFLTDSTAASDDYTVNVEANAFDITNATDTRLELQFVGDGSINFGDNTATKTIDIGGVTSSGTDTINIATNSTLADVVTIGNNNAATTVAITGGDDWVITSTGNLSTLGVLQAGGITPTTYSRFGTGTTGHAGNISSTSDLLVSSDVEIDGNLYLDGGTIANSAGTAAVVLSGTPTTTANTLSASNWLVENTANVGQAALMVNQTKSGDLLTASASGITKFTVQNDGDVVLSNQLQLGNLASNPTALGAGAMYFNTTTNTNQCYNGTSWFNCGGTLYSNTNASVADGSYITVTHNLATNDLLSSAWISAQGLWKELDSSYKPAIAWEGKDTQKGVYHNSVNEYTSTNETSLTSTALNTGLLYDTFEDSIKTDSANTTVSVSTDMGDNGSANYITLDQRVQEGRVGLMGGQTYNTATNDNDGQAYLGSNTVNDIFYYDRSKDSAPEVLVELGIDPNWYNGVTLSVATTSASYSQAGTLAEKNPNLTTSYNGSLIKATGTDTTPRTIYITIKSPTTFDWTNYQGDSATGVTITPGTAQTLGDTGVSATFTAANYNTGDVFKIASWYIEAEGTTRGTKQQFPERSIVIAQGTAGTGYIDVIDADTQKLWMRFTEGTGYYVRATSNRVPVTTTMLNGKLYFGMNDSGVANAGIMERVNFDTDSLTLWTTAGKFAYDQSISLRNSTSNLVTLGADEAIVVNHPNDITATVIPNQPTQEITVSGWGYIPHDGVSVAIGETINLPFTFNNKPSVVANFAGLTSSGVTPTSLSNCNANSGLNGTVGAITERTISINIRHNDNTTVIGSNFNSCYTWTATGIVSPKQFVATATGATTTDGGTTIINETDGTKSDLLVGSQNANVIWQTKIAFSKNNELYVSVDDSTANTTYIGTYYGVHGLASEPTWAQYRNGYYRIGTKSDGWAASGPTILGSATGTSQVQSLYATNNTSTIVPNSNTIYVGTASGVSVINEKQGFGNVFDSSVEYSGSVKYYTKDYVSEEMIGDIRGMWPLNGNNTSSDLEDISVKANVLTATNITAADAVSGVRGEAYDFNGIDEYIGCTDAACGGTSKLDTTGTQWSVGMWIKSPNITKNSVTIIGKRGATVSYEIRTNGTTGKIDWVLNTGGVADAVTSNKTLLNNEWYHVVATYNGVNKSIYIDGQLDVSEATTGAIADSAEVFRIGARGDGTLYYEGIVDEPFVTATALTPAQIKNMYQVGYRALQSHGTGLGGGAADTNQQLGYISTGTSSVGAVAVDDNNQYMYVGTKSTTLGALSKVQLNSDTNIKTYTSSANVPTGGTTLIDEDVNSLAVGETLYAVGSAASGVKSMGVDNNSTATSGNFVSKTYVLPKNIGSAVLWVSGVTDASDGSNTLTVKASNDSGSNYVTCTLVNTNSNPAVPEKEYACTFSTADNDLKIKFEFVRGSTKTNTYVVQYGISWLGETGFRVEQTDTNNVRLYNFSGETQNLKLNVTGASTSQLANPWTDGGSYLYPTGYEALRIYDGAGTNYLGLSHDGTLANLTYNGSTVLSINSTGDLLPNTDDAQSLGSNTKRWKDLFLGGETLHIGTSTTDEGTISYTTSSNILNFGTDSTSNGDIAFFTNDLYLDKSAGYVGIGTTSPSSLLSVYAPLDSAAIATTFTIGDGTYGFQMGNTTNVGFAPRIMGSSYDSTDGMSLVSSILSGSDTGTAPAFTIDSRLSTGAVLATRPVLSIRNYTTDITTFLANGNVGIGTTSPQTTLDVNGNFSGADIEYSYADTTNQTYNVTDKALVYRLANNSLTSNTTQTTTFNITGLPDNSGTVAHIVVYARKGSTAGSQTTTVIVQINGVQISSTATPTQVASNITQENYTVVYVGGSWRILGVGSSDSADLAEIFGSQEYLAPGTLVSVNKQIEPTSYFNEKDQEITKAWIQKTDQKHQDDILGIVSTDPAISLSKDVFQPDEYPTAVALSGRVPVRIDPMSESINAGDMITSSGNDGMGMKAQHAGFVVGKALENWDQSSGKDKILVFVSHTWYDPTNILNSIGEIEIDNQNYAVLDTKNQSIIKKITAYSEAVIGKIQTGFIKAIGLESISVNTKIISPIADSDLIIDLDPNDNNSPSKLAIKGVNDEEVASIDASGNAAFDGTITGQDLYVDNDATISGTLYADNIESKRIEDIENLLQEVEANQSLLAQAATWNANTATESASLEGVFETITTNQLFVTEQIAATSLFVSDNFTTKNINSLNSALQIQSLAASPLEIMAGKIIVDTNGDTKFMGNVEIAGNLTVNNIIVANNIDPIATESATIVEGEINSNSTAGKALLAADTESIRINNNKVSQNTLIYITPITSTQNKVLYVKAKGEGYFEVGFSDTLDTDVEFNWWIIELANFETVEPENNDTI